jgi:hypothetical protein
LKLLQSKHSEAFVDYIPQDTSNGRVIRPKHFAGRTMDLTLFAVTRALDVVVGELWSQRRLRRTLNEKWNKVSIAQFYRDVSDPIYRSIS